MNLLENIELSDQTRDQLLVDRGKKTRTDAAKKRVSDQCE
jgi:hypothetical protein